MNTVAISGHSISECALTFLKNIYANASCQKLSFWARAHQSAKYIVVLLIITCAPAHSAIKLIRMDRGHIAVNSATNRIYIAAFGGITVVNGANYSVIARIPTNTYPTGIAINEATNRIYIAGYEL